MTNCNWELSFWPNSEAGGQAEDEAPEDGSSQPNGGENALSKWEQYAQVLLSANEFMYVD